MLNCTLALIKIFESVVVYLKTPRRRREQISIRRRLKKYRCVPKIASSEARTNLIRKCNEKYVHFAKEGEAAAGRSAYLTGGGLEADKGDYRRGGFGTLPNQCVFDTCSDRYCKTNVFWDTFSDRYRKTNVFKIL